MKALLTSLFAALFAFGAVAGYAATDASAKTLYNSDEAKDEAKSPSPTTEQKGDEDKDKDKDKDDKKS